MCLKNTNVIDNIIAVKPEFVNFGEYTSCPAIDKMQSPLYDVIDNIYRCRKEISITGT
jgi:hypothetical protein